MQAFPGLLKASFLFPTLRSEWGLNGSVQQEELLTFCPAQATGYQIFNFILMYCSFCLLIG